MEQLTHDIWKTVDLKGEFATGKHCCSALRLGGCSVDPVEEEIFERARFSTDQGIRKLDLVILSVAELGFENGARRAQIYDRAQDLGLSLCPHELGPYLRLQYRDQPKEEGIMIAMDPILDRAGIENIFYIGHDIEGLWLGAYSCETNFWYGNERWIFVRR